MSRIKREKSPMDKCVPTLSVLQSLHMGWLNILGAAAAAAVADAAAFDSCNNSGEAVSFFFFFSCITSIFRRSLTHSQVGYEYKNT